MGGWPTHRKGGQAGTGSTRVACRQQEEPFTRWLLCVVCTGMTGAPSGCCSCGQHAAELVTTATHRHNGRLADVQDAQPDSRRQPAEVCRQRVQPGSL